jgi:hypothetical protein
MAKIEANNAASHQPLRETTDSMSLPSLEMSEEQALVAILRRSIDQDQISPRITKMAEVRAKNCAGSVPSDARYYIGAQRQC